MVVRKLTRVLAATDGAEAGEHAVRVARQLADRAGAELETLSVEPVGLPVLAGAGTGPEHSNGAHPTRWVRGIPGLEITHRAKGWGADLVVLGRDHRRPDNPLPLGRTADTVVRRLEMPCLLVPANVSKLTRVVLAVDGTRRGLGVFEPAARLVAALGAEFQAVHVLPEHAAPLTPEARRNEPAVQRILPELAGHPGLGTAALEVLQGSPVWELLAFLDRTHADVLMLGVRGGGPTGDMGSGHIGRDLLRTAPIAILTIPI